jgi:hypothetical protein
VKEKILKEEFKKKEKEKRRRKRRRRWGAWIFFCFVCVVCFQEQVVQSNPADSGVSCVITKRRGQAGHSLCWAAEPEILIIIRWKWVLHFTPQLLKVGTLVPIKLFHLFKVQVIVLYLGFFFAIS